MISFNKNKDVIAVIAPASMPINGQQDVDNIEQALSAENFKFIASKNILAGDCLKFFAASKKIRLKTFTEALLNEQVKIILQIRGGYGGVEFIFECLNVKPSGPKIFIGFSDGTALHFLFNQRYNMSSIHGNIVDKELKIDQNTIALLQGAESIFDLTPINEQAEKNSQILSGTSIGGNLTIVCNMIGTELSPHTKDKILIIEDVNEKGYHVHRHLMHLKNAGILAEIKAIVFGDFTDSDEHLEPAVYQFCAQHISHIPAYRTEGLGHGKINKPFTLGAEAIIKGNILEIDSPFKLV